MYTGTFEQSFGNFAVLSFIEIIISFRNVLLKDLFRNTYICKIKISFTLQFVRLVLMLCYCCDG